MRDRVLVLGAGGFIGRHLVHSLVARGQDVIAASRGNVEIFPDGASSALRELRNPEDFEPLVSACGAVVHLASASTPGSTAGDPLAELDANLRPTLALLDAMQAHPQTRLVYVSSGGSLYAPTETSADEHSRISPRSYHGAGKAAGEHFIDAWSAQYATSAAVVRPTNVYGPGQRGRAGFAVIPTAMERVRDGGIMTIWGDGSSVRDYLFVDDLIALCLLILDAPATTGVRTVNAASGIGVSLNALLAQIEQVSGRALQRTYLTLRGVDAHRVVADPSLARLTYGWSATIGLHEGLQRTWDWSTTIRR